MGCCSPVGESNTAHVPPDESRVSRSGVNPRASPQGAVRSRGSRAGRPRDGAPKRVESWTAGYPSSKGVQRGTPTVCTRRKAAVLGARGRVRRTPPGSERGAGLQRGNAGTWESPLSPCAMPGRGDRVTIGPGVVLGLPPGDEPARETTNGGSTHGIGARATSEGPREGQRGSLS
jgi:hypothetical protein